MKTMTENVSEAGFARQSGPRIDAVDALRGFALIGVGLVHTLYQYVGAPLTEPLSQSAVTGQLDTIIMFVNHLVLSGKFYLIFSLLFGLSFFIQIDKPSRRGEPYTTRFAWRLTILLAIGYIHHFFFRSDILMVYALLGFSLLALHRLPTRVLIVIASAMFLGLGRFVSFALYSEPLPYHRPDSALTLAYIETLRHGSLWDVMVVNSVDGIHHVMTYLFGVYGRGYVTFALFLVGICLGRWGIFTNLSERGRLVKKTLIWASVCAPISFALTMVAFSGAGQPPDFTTWREALALTFFDLFNLALGTVFACLFLLAIRGPRLGARLSRLFAPYGRMALTNYLLQTALGTAFFYGWGLGQLGEWSNRYLLLMGLGMAAAQILLSHVWMKRFYYGPCEWLWRTLTYRRPMAFRRRNMPLPVRQMGQA